MIIKMEMELTADNAEEMRKELKRLLFGVIEDADSESRAATVNAVKDLEDFKKAGAFKVEKVEADEEVSEVSPGDGED